MQYGVVYEAYGAEEGRDSEQHRLLAKLLNCHQLICIHHLRSGKEAVFDQRSEQPGTLVEGASSLGCLRTPLPLPQVAASPGNISLQDVGHLHVVHAPARCRHPLGDALPQRLHARRVGAGASFLRPLRTHQQSDSCNYMRCSAHGRLYVCVPALLPICCGDRTAIAPHRQVTIADMVNKQSTPEAYAQCSMKEQIHLEASSAPACLLAESEPMQTTLGDKLPTAAAAP